MYGRLFFYGKPSYPVAEKFAEKRTDSYYCPICFIVNPEKVSIYDVYPFDTGAFDIDERTNTVEVISNECVTLREAVECIILPNNMLRDRTVKNFFDKYKIKYKTYRFGTLMKPERYYEAVFQLTMEYISERQE